MILTITFFIIAGILAWRFPREAVLAFPAILPLYLLRFHLGPLPTTALECIFLGVAASLTIKTRGKIWLEGFNASRPWHLALTAWALVSFFAVFVAQDHVAALGLWRAYILEPVLFMVLVFGTRKETKDNDALVTAFVAATVFVTLYAIVQFVTGWGIPHPWNTDILTRRATGPFGFPNALALFTAPIGALCLGWIVQKYTTHTLHLPLRKGESSGGARGGSLLLWLGFFSAIIATLLARSTGGVLAIAAAVGLVLLFTRRTRLPTIIIGIVGLSLVFAITPIRTRVIKKITFQEWSGKVRTVIWKETVTMLRDRPLFGAGLGGYPDGIKPYHKATWMEIFQYPHNILLNLWSEVGVLGVLAFTFIVATWIRVAWKTERYLLLPLIAILVHGLVDVPYFKNDLAMAFWMFALLATPLTSSTHTIPTETGIQKST